MFERKSAQKLNEVGILTADLQDTVFKMTISSPFIPLVVLSVKKEPGWKSILANTQMQSLNLIANLRLNIGHASPIRKGFTVYKSSWDH